MEKETKKIQIETGIDNTKEKEILKHALDSLLEVKAQNIKIYKTKDVNPFFSYALVASAVASRQLDGLASRVNEKARDFNLHVRGIEGRGGGSWLLVDLDEVIIHLFSLEDRKYYDLDKLWATLPQIDPESIE